MPPGPGPYKERDARGTAYPPLMPGRPRMAQAALSRLAASEATMTATPSPLDAWNRHSGYAWLDLQPVLDGMFLPLQEALID